MFWGALSVYMVLAFAWCEQALSFSLSTPTAAVRSEDMKIIRPQLKGSEMQRRRMEYLSMRMEANGSSSSDIDPVGSDKGSENQSKTGEKGVSTDNNSQANNVILVVPLILKFMVVLMIKFLTDLVVFPSLFLYRLARRGKRKVVNLFDRSSSTIKPNGSTE